MKAAHMRLSRLLGLVMLIAVAGCADANAGSATPPQAAGGSTSPIKGGPDLVVHPFDPPDSYHEFIYTREIRSSLLLDPNANYPITAEQAVSNAADNGFATGDPERPDTPTATLRSVTIGSDAHAFTKPAWVLIWSNSQLVEVGKAQVNGEPDEASIPANPRCEFIVVIDAKTGDGYKAGQLCG